MNRYGLRTDNARRRRTVEQRQKRAIERNADERHHLRTVAPDLPVQHTPRLDVFRRAQVIDSWTRSRDQIGDAEIPFWQPIVILVRDRYRHQTRIGQEFPEPIRIPGEMVPGFRRTHARVDPDKQHTKTRPNAIPQAQVGPVWPYNSAFGFHFDQL